MGVFDLHRKDYPFFWPGVGGGGGAVLSCSMQNL